MAEPEKSRILRINRFLLLIVLVCPFVIGKVIFADDEAEPKENGSNPHFLQEADVDNSLWPLQVGQVWVYIVTDSREPSSPWTMELHILETVNIESSDYYHIGSYDLRADEWETGVVFINSDEDFVYKWDEDEYSVWPRDEMVAEQVDVPYGQFDAVYYDEGNYYNYFVPGVGLVKTHQIEDEYTITSELVDIHPPVPKTIIYVDDNAAGANDGTSWAEAYVYLQDALADANSTEKPVEIRVAQGIYKPDQGENQIPGVREAIFQLINDVTLRGCYAGIDGADPNERNLQEFITILSGDLNGDDVEIVDPCDLPDEPTRAENSYHVVTSNGTDANTILDGFTIAGGNANGTEPHNYGGGLYNLQSDLTLVNCNLHHNTAISSGGAIYNSEGQPLLDSCMFKCNHASAGGAVAYRWVNTKLVNCTFKNNSSLYWGGALESYGQSLELVDCIFINNSAGQSGGSFNNSSASATLVGCRFIGNKSGDGGGAIVNQTCNAKLTNCIFIANYAKTRGGGIFSRLQTDLNLMNCTFHHNSSDGNGGSIYNSYSNATIRNCIMWDNSAPNGTEISLNTTDYPSNVSVAHSNIRNGEPAIDIEDGCTLVWSDGNINEDPLFAEAGYWADVDDPNVATEPHDPNAVWIDGDYHLKSETGRWNPSSESWIKDDVTSPCIDAGDPNSDFSGETWPHGGRINMGAYGGTRQASMSLETEGMFLPQVAYIFSDNDEVDDSFRSLLEAYGCSTTHIRSVDVTATPLDSYDLIIVANDTQYEDTWSDPNIVAAIEDSGKPIVGLGDGGYDFFGLLGLSIGNPYGGHSSKHSVEVVDPNSSLFSTPYSIEIPEERVLQLYTETRHIEIYLWPTIPESVTVIGRKVDDVAYHPLIMEHHRYLLWGFTESPQKMTEVGKTLFINVVIWTANEAWEGEN